MDDIDLDDLDDDLDFGDDDFDFDVDSEVVDDRSPVTKVASGVLSSLTDSVTNPAEIASATKNVLPKEFQPIVTETERAFTTSVDLYKKTLKSAEPLVNDLKSIARKKQSTIDKVLPSSMANWIRSKTEEKEDTGIRQSDPVGDAITAAMGDVFGSNEADRERDEAKANAEVATIEATMAKGQYDAAALTAIKDLLQRQTGFQESVFSKYLKHSLDLEYRQYFIARDHFSAFGHAMTQQRALLESIVKNTALPEEVKRTMSEHLQDNMMVRLYGSAYESVSDRARGGLSKFAENLHGKLADTIEEFSSLSGMLDGAISEDGDDDSGMPQMDKYEMAGMMGGGELLGFLTDRFGERLAKMLMKQKWFVKMVNDGLYATENVSAHLNEFADSETEKDGYMGSIMDFIKESIEGYATPDLAGMDFFDRDEWTVKRDELKYRSITQIIPEHLAAIRQLIEQDTKDPTAERMVFNPNANRLVRESELSNYISERVISKSTALDAGREMDGAIGELDKDDELSAEAKRVLRESMYKDAINDRTFNVERYSEESNYESDDDSIRKEITTLINKRFMSLNEETGDLEYVSSPETSVSRQKMAKAIGSVRRGDKSPTSQLQNLHGYGMSDVLYRMGLVKSDDGDTKIDQKAIREHYLDLMSHTDDIRKFDSVDSKTYRKMSRDEQRDYDRRKSEHEAYEKSELTRKMAESSFGKKVDIETQSTTSMDSRTDSTVRNGDHLSSQSDSNLSNVDHETRNERSNESSYRDHSTEFETRRSHYDSESTRKIDRETIQKVLSEQTNEAPKAYTIEWPDDMIINSATLSDVTMMAFSELFEQISKDTSFDIDTSRMEAQLKELIAQSESTLEAMLYDSEDTREALREGFGLVVASVTNGHLFEAEQQATQEGGKSGGRIGFMGELKDVLGRGARKTSKYASSLFNWSTGLYSSAYHTLAELVPSAEKLKSLGSGLIDNYMPKSTVYVGDDPSPVILPRDFRRGRIVDEDGKVIKSPKGINGPVRRADTGELVLSQEQYDQGLRVVTPTGRLMELSGEGLKANFQLSNAVRNKITEWIDPTYASPKMDVYVEGNGSPALSGSGIRNRQYLDITTNRVIESFEDIQGPVLDLETGRQVITQEQYDQGLTNGTESTLASETKDAWLGMHHLPMAVMKRAKDLVWHKDNGTGRKAYDLYQSNPKTPDVFKYLMEQGEYVDADTGEPVYKVEDIVGSLLDSEGNIALDMDRDAKAPWAYVKGRTVPLYDLGVDQKSNLGQVAEVAANGLVGGAKMYGSLLKKTYGGMMHGAGWVVDRLRGKKGSSNGDGTEVGESMDSGFLSSEILNDISGTLRTSDLTLRDIYHLLMEWDQRGGISPYHSFVPTEPMDPSGPSSDTTERRSDRNSHESVFTSEVRSEEVIIPPVSNVDPRDQSETVEYIKPEPEEKLTANVKDKMDKVVPKSIKDILERAKATLEPEAKEPSAKEQLQEALASANAKMDELGTSAQSQFNVALRAAKERIGSVDIDAEPETYRDQVRDWFAMQPRDDVEPKLAEYMKSNAGNIRRMLRDGEVTLDDKLSDVKEVLHSKHQRYGEWLHRRDTEDKYQLNEFVDQPFHQTAVRKAVLEGIQSNHPQVQNQSLMALPGMDDTKDTEPQRSLIERARASVDSKDLTGQSKEMMNSIRNVVRRQFTQEDKVEEEHTTPIVDPEASETKWYDRFNSSKLKTLRENLEELTLVRNLDDVKATELYKDTQTLMTDLKDSTTTKEASNKVSKVMEDLKQVMDRSTVKDTVTDKTEETIVEVRNFTDQLRAKFPKLAPRVDDEVITDNSEVMRIAPIPESMSTSAPELPYTSTDHRSHELTSTSVVAPSLPPAGPTLASSQSMITQALEAWESKQSEEDVAPAEGSWQDQLKDREMARTTEREESMHTALWRIVDALDGERDSDTDTFLDELGGLFGDDDGDGNTNIDLGGEGRDKDEKKKNRKSKSKRPKGRLGRLAQAIKKSKVGSFLGRTGSKIGGVVRGAGGIALRSAGGLAATAGLSSLTGAGIGGTLASVGGTLATVGGSVLTGAATLASSPIVLGGLAVAGLGYGGYKAYNWWKNRRDMEGLDRLRALEYGIDPTGDSTDEIRNIEALVEKRAKLGRNPRIDMDEETMEEYLDIVDADTDDPESVRDAVAWFNTRFKPVYLRHRSALGSYEEVDQIPQVKRKDYVKAMRPALGTDVYNTPTAPPGIEMSVGAGQIHSIYQDISDKYGLLKSKLEGTDATNVGMSPAGTMVSDTESKGPSPRNRDVQRRTQFDASNMAIMNANLNGAEDSTFAVSKTNEILSESLSVQRETLLEIKRLQSLVGIEPTATEEPETREPNKNRAPRMGRRTLGRGVDVSQ